ncbi:MAG: hypothetical protein ACPIOQ_61815, partial [Promethearchaeia archaeon]
PRPPGENGARPQHRFLCGLDPRNRVQDAESTTGRAMRCEKCSPTGEGPLKALAPAARASSTTARMAS